MCFLKFDQDRNNIGKEFKYEKTTMFDLYFKEIPIDSSISIFFRNITNIENGYLIFKSSMSNENMKS